MPKTFAFSNKGNFWKTRYSFTPAHYSHVNKYLYSYPLQVTTGPANDTAVAIPHLHHYGADLCRWYGTQYTSAVAFSFNDNVSANKMYRSVSIEGTNNVNGVAQLVVNNSSSANQIKTTAAVNFRERGGILYSPLAGSQLRSNKSIVTLGTVTAVDFFDYDAATGRLQVLFQLDWIRGAKAKIFRSTTLETALWTMLPNGQINKFLIAPSGVGSPAAVANWQAATPDIFNATVGDADASNFLGTNGFLATFDFTEWAEALSTDDNVLTVPADISEASALLVQAYADQVGMGAFGVGLTLIAMTPDEVNGGKPQGQYADMVMTLGSNPYEIYAFNAYYQANTLDHSK